MANENNKPYFLLIFHKNDPMPSIVSADVIAEMYPCAEKKGLILQPRKAIAWASIMSSRLKWFQSRKLTLTCNNNRYEENNQDICW